MITPLPACIDICQEIIIHVCMHVASSIDQLLQLTRLVNPCHIPYSILPLSSPFTRFHLTSPPPLPHPHPFDSSPSSPSSWLKPHSTPGEAQPSREYVRSRPAFPSSPFNPRSHNRVHHQLTCSSIHSLSVDSDARGNAENHPRAQGRRTQARPLLLSPPPLPLCTRCPSRTLLSLCLWLPPACRLLS